MTFHEVKDLCIKFVQENPGMTMEDVGNMFINQQSDLGLSDLDLAKLLYHLGIPQIMPEDCLQALRDNGLIRPDQDFEGYNAKNL